MEENYGKKGKNIRNKAASLFECIKKPFNKRDSNKENINTGTEDLHEEVLSSDFSNLGQIARNSGFEYKYGDTESSKIEFIGSSIKDSLIALNNSEHQNNFVCQSSFNNDKKFTDGLLKNKISVSEDEKFLLPINNGIKNNEENESVMIKKEKNNKRLIQNLSKNYKKNDEMVKFEKINIRDLEIQGLKKEESRDEEIIKEKENTEKSKNNKKFNLESIVNKVGVRNISIKNIKMKGNKQSVLNNNEQRILDKESSMKKVEDLNINDIKNDNENLVNKNIYINENEKSFNNKNKRKKIAYKLEQKTNENFDSHAANEATLTNVNVNNSYNKNKLGDSEENLFVEISHILTKPSKVNAKKQTLVKKTQVVKEKFVIYFVSEKLVEYNKSLWLKKFPKLEFKTKNNCNKIHQVYLNALDAEISEDSIFKKALLIIDMAVNQYKEEFITNKLGNQFLSKIYNFYGLINEVSLILSKRFSNDDLNRYLKQIKIDGNEIDPIFSPFQFIYPKDLTLETFFLKKLYTECIFSQLKLYKKRIKSTNNNCFKKVEKFAKHISLIYLKGEHNDKILMINQLIILIRAKSMFLNTTFTKYQKKYILMELQALKDNFVVFKKNDIDLLSEKLIVLLCTGFSKENNFSSVLYEIFNTKAAKNYKNIIIKLLNTLNDHIKLFEEENKNGEYYEFILHSQAYLKKKMAPKFLKTKIYISVLKFYKIFLFTSELVSFTCKLIFYYKLGKKDLNMVEFEKLEERYLFLRDFVALCEIN